MGSCLALFVVRGSLLLFLLLHSINEQRHFESSPWGTGFGVKRGGQQHLQRSKKKMV